MLALKLTKNSSGGGFPWGTCAPPASKVSASSVGAPEELTGTSSASISSGGSSTVEVDAVRAGGRGGAFAVLVLIAIVSSSAHIDSASLAESGVRGVAVSVGSGVTVVFANGRERERFNGKGELVASSAGGGGGVPRPI